MKLKGIYIKSAISYRRGKNILNEERSIMSSIYENGIRQKSSLFDMNVILFLLFIKKSDFLSKKN
jgi:hypothetical protein